MSERILSTERRENDRNKLIRTFTGRYVNPLALRVEDVCIEDIAHHLSLECRYTGACPYHYSVAQHSVYVSQCYNTPVLKLTGLLHDASEAYLKDLPSPIKHDPRMAFYREIEEQVSATIFKCFGLNSDLICFVKDADNITFKNEVACFWGENDNSVVAWMPWTAEDEFLKAFHRYQVARSI